MQKQYFQVFHQLSIKASRRLFLGQSSVLSLNMVSESIQNVVEIDEYTLKYKISGYSGGGGTLTNKVKVLIALGGLRAQLGSGKKSNGNLLTRKPAPFKFQAGVSSLCKVLPCFAKFELWHPRFKYRSISVEKDFDCRYDSFRLEWNGNDGSHVTPGRGRKKHLFSFSSFSFQFFFTISQSKFCYLFFFYFVKFHTVRY